MRYSLFDADFAQTALGRKQRRKITIYNLIRMNNNQLPSTNVKEYTIDQQLSEEASLGII